MSEEIVKNRFTLAVKIILFLLLLVFLYFIRDIILLFIVSLIMAFIFLPLVDWLEKKKISRFLGTTFIYLILLLIMVGFLFLIIPSLASEVSSLSQRFFTYYQEMQKILNLVQKFLPVGMINLQTWQDSLTSLSQWLFSLVGGFINGIFSFVLIMVISFYLIVEKKSFSKFIKKIVSEKYSEFVSNLISLSQQDLSRWGWAMIVLMIFIGVTTYIGLLILDIRFALILAVIAGLTELVPRVGPVIGAIPAIVLAFFQSPIKALMVIIFYILVQQIENIVVVPQVMKKATGLNPIIVILVILIGAKLGGAIGAVVAIPVTAVVFIFIHEYLKLKEQIKIEK